MGRHAQVLLGLLPRRRRRLWRYVSPRRRGLGVFLLALLLTATYGYWLLTNDGRIRREAQRYLSSLTGLRVRIAEAQFSLFGPVRLRNVRVYMQGSLSEHPFFRAETVMLRHNPWRLLTRGTIQPREIVCIEPVVTFEQDESGQDRGREKLMSMVARSQKQSAAGWREPLPEIRLRQGKLQRVQIRRPSEAPGAKPTFALAAVPVNLSMIPQGTGTYVIRFEERSEGKGAYNRGEVVWDLRTGKHTVEGDVPNLPSLQLFLPPKYRDWLSKYDIKTNFSIRGGMDTGYTVTLKNLSMALPPAEGGVKLVDVLGVIVFHEDKVELKGVTGRPLPRRTRGPPQEAPQTRLRIHGEYLGYEPTSDFSVNLDVKQLRFPSDLEPSGELGKAIRWLQQEYQPHGDVNVAIRYERKGGGAVTYSGSAWPQRISGTYKWFRYPLTHVAGKIDFTSKEAKLIDLTGRHGDGRFTINGTVQMRGRAYDVIVRAEPSQFDEQLRQALPRRYQEVWRTVSPGGLAAATVHVSQRSRKEDPRVRLEMTLDGHATMRYRQFPYPLEGIVGQVHVAGDAVQITRVVGRHGPMRCTIIGGRITGLGTKRPGVDMVVEATDVPLDKTLEAALGPYARQALANLHAVGRADRISAKIHQEPGRSLQHDIRVWLRGVTLKPQAFPYEITDASGTVTITPEGTVVRDLRGRHGESTIAVKDSAFLVDKELGLDLRAEGKDVRLDEALYAAIPPKARELWRSFSPAGVADVKLHYVSNMPPHRGKVDYRLELQAKGVAISYEKFPYPFQGILGQVVITPDLVEFEKLATASGRMRAQVGGSVRSTPDGSWVELKVQARDLPVDEKLLKALPEDLALVAKRLKTGGACDVTFKRLAFLSPPDTKATTRPSGGPPGPARPAGGAAAGEGAEPARLASKPDGAAAASTGPHPVSRPTTVPARPTWYAIGDIRLRGVSADLGYGYKELTGTIRGLARMKPEGLQLNADIALDSVALGSKKLTNLKGRLAKGSRSGVIRVTDLLGKVHGGRMSGFARIKGPEPFYYALSLCVEGVDLAEFLNAGVKDPKKRTDVQGLLTGDIKLSGKAGVPASAEGEGTLRITKAKLYKLPVLLGALHVVMLALPVQQQTAFTEGHVIYRIRGQQLVFQEIYLTGPVLSIVGSGTMNLKTHKLRLTFLTGQPGRLPRMASLPEKLLGLAGELLKVFLSELAQIEVHGTLKKPIMRTVPLRSLNTAIGRLTNPEQQPD